MTHQNIKKYFHGSKTKGIKRLTPDVSLHGEKYVYLTTSYEVALIYTANAIESFYEDNNLEEVEKFQPWYSYGFNEKKIPVIEEYYPNATEKTYADQSGYIYVCQKPKQMMNPTNIFNAVVTKETVLVQEVIYIENIYEEILKLEKQGKLKVKRYEDMDKTYLNHIYHKIKLDIKKYDLINRPNHHYAVFLKSHFPFLFDQKG